MATVRLLVVSYVTDEVEFGMVDLGQVIGRCHDQRIVGARLGKRQDLADITDARILEYSEDASQMVLRANPTDFETSIQIGAGGQLPSRPIHNPVARQHRGSYGPRHA